MSLYFVRHGQTDWNLQGRLQGKSDIALNAIGIQQAQETSALLKDIPIERIYCSPLQRAKQTAAILQQQIQCPLWYEERLAERCFGDLEGVYLKDITTYLWDFEKLPCPHAESMTALFNRVQSFLQEIVHDIAEHDYLIVAHGGVYLPVYAFFNTLEHQQDLMQIVPKNCTVTKFDRIVQLAV